MKLRKFKPVLIKIGKFSSYTWLVSTLLGNKFMEHLLVHSGYYSNINDWVAYKEQKYISQSSGS